MKQRLPFRLSAAGALSLVVTQAFYLPTAHAQANLSIDPNGQATPGSAVDSTLTIQQSGSTSPQSASTTAANVQDSIVSAIGGDFVNRANEVLASTTGNIAAAAQVVAAGEDSVATAIAQSLGATSGQTATVSNSSVGAVATGAISGAGSIAVSANRTQASAQGNSATASLLADTAQSGTTGDNPSVATNIGGSLSLTGDLLSGSRQTLTGSAITATVEAGVGGSLVTGLALNNAAADFSATGGVAVDANAVAASASGNRLSTVLTDQLAGTDVDVAVGALQQAVDSNIASSVDGARIGLAGQASGASYSNAPLSVTANQLSSTSTGNAATSRVVADLTGAGDSAAVRSAQNLTANTASAQPYAVSSQTINAVVGATTNAAALSGVNATVSDNQISARSTGQSLDNGFTAAPGRVDGIVNLSASQTLSATNAGLSFTSRVGDDTAPVDIGVDANLAGGDLVNSQLQVSGNQVTAATIANSGRQALDAVQGVVSADPFIVSLEQRADQTAAANSIAATADIESLSLGVSSVRAIDGTGVNVVDNRVVGSATLNQGSLQTGGVIGSLDSSQEASTTQSVVASDATTTLSEIQAGIRDTGALIAQNGDVRVLLSGNVIAGQAESNRSEEAVGELRGDARGTLSAETTQSVSGIGGNVATAQSTVSNVGLGLRNVTGNIGNLDNAFDLDVVGNSISSTANQNVAVREVGAVAVSGAPNVSRTATQTTADSRALASLSGVSAGLSGTVGALANTSDGVTFNITDNSAAATARGNVFSEVADGVSGSIQGPRGVLSKVTQTSGLNSVTQANVSSVSFGFSGYDADLNLGGTSGGTTVNLVDNRVRSEATSNLSSIALGGVSGAVSGRIAAESSATAAAVNANTDTVSAQLSSVTIGQSAPGQSPQIASVGTTSYDISRNATLASVAANRGSLDLGGFDGSLTGKLELSGTQANQANVAASSTTVRIGISDRSQLAPATGSLSVAVSGNEVATAASGNALSSTLGAITGNLAGTVSSLVNQSSTADSDLDATTTGAEIGLTVFGQIGRGQADTARASIAVDGNRVRTTVVGNSASDAVSLAGSLSGTVRTDAQQTNTFAGNEYSAVTTNTNIGLGDGANGSGVTVALSDNSVLSSITGNQLSSLIDGASLSQTGTVEYGATQSNVGGAAPSELSAAVNGTTVAVRVGGAPTTIPSTVVSGNQLVAAATANDSQRRIAGLSGQIDGGLLSVSDTQSNTNLGVSASLAGAQFGAEFNSTSAVPLNLVSSDNVAIADAVGNRAVQVADIGGLSLTGGADVLMTARQSNVGSSINSTVSGVRVGLVTPGSGAYTGSAVSNGNSVGANAVGNSARITRGR